MNSIIHYIHSIEKLEEFLMTLKNQHPNFQPVFRGQASNNIDWTLRPKLARYFKQGDESKFIKTEKEIISEFKASVIENNLSEHFYLFSEKFVGDYCNDWQWLIHATHYELPTRLMDWSFEYNTALYFSAMDENNYDGESGVLWIFLANRHPIFWKYEDICFKINPVSIEETIFAKINFYPSKNVANNRRYNQHGYFVVQNEYNSLLPFENDPLYSSNLIKIIIHKDFKAKLKVKYINDKSHYLPERNEQIVKIVNDLKCKYKL